VRAFEGLTVLALILTLIEPFVPGDKRWRVVDPILIAAATTGLHLLAEGPRWQMIPLYLLVAVLGTLRLRNFLGKEPLERDRRRLPPWAVVAGLVVLASGAALLFLLPVARLPEPEGPYAIGETTYHWVDRAREEIYGPTPGGPREIMVQITYPAEYTGGVQPKRWLDHPEVIAPQFTTWAGLPSFLLTHARYIQTHSYPDAPVAPGGPFPVLVYIHGWGGLRNINQDQLEYLASYGYIVVSADHTYGALATVFPDGRVALNDPDALPEGVPDEEHDRAANLLVRTYAADVGFMLDQLEALNANDPDGRFTGQMNLERLGVFGHSTGGGAAIELCAQDARCKAAFGQDAWVEPVSTAVQESAITQPLLLINSETWRTGENSVLQRAILENTHDDAFLLSITGTRHYDFVMVPLFSPLAPALGMKGPLPAAEVLKINHAYLLAFFEQELRGHESALLAGPSPEYPEVSFETFETQQTAP